LIDALTPISICSAEEVVNAMFQLSMLDFSTDVVIGNSKLTTISKIILDFIKQRNDLNIEFVEINSQETMVQPYLLPNTLKARQILEWNPQISPVDILMDIFNSKTNPTNHS
jgi:nucleoside-diphosphate-sugar epimerase